MSRSVSVAEAKNKLPSILREVEEGTIVEITRYGKSGSDGTSRKRLQTLGGERARILGESRESEGPYLLRRDCY